MSMSQTRRLRRGAGRRSPSCCRGLQGLACLPAACLGLPDHSVPPEDPPGRCLPSGDRLTRGFLQRRGQGPAHHGHPEGRCTCQALLVTALGIPTLPVRTYAQGVGENRGPGQRDWALSSSGISGGSLFL